MDEDGYDGERVRDVGRRREREIASWEHSVEYTLVLVLCRRKQEKPADTQVEEN